MHTFVDRQAQDTLDFAAVLASCLASIGVNNCLIYAWSSIRINPCLKSSKNQSFDDHQLCSYHSALSLYQENLTKRWIPIIECCSAFTWHKNVESNSVLSHCKWKFGQAFRISLRKLRTLLSLSTRRVTIYSLDHIYKKSLRSLSLCPVSKCKVTCLVLASFLL
jgi:hypothetical protein